MKSGSTSASCARTRLRVRNAAEKRNWVKMLVRPLLVMASIVQAGCASSPDSISARYVSPNMYQNWTCDQLVDERMRLTKEVQRISGLQRENANADVAMMTVGLIIFWPALIGLAATKDRKGELGQLKGEYDAVDLSMRTRQCTLPAPGAPSVPAVATPQTDAALASAEGTYKGRGKTDAWCQTPSMTVTLRGTVIQGELSEISNGNATSSISGTIDYAGVATLSFKGTKPDYYSGQADGVFKNGVFSMTIQSKATNSCTYQFELQK